MSASAASDPCAAGEGEPVPAATAYTPVSVPAPLTKRATFTSTVPLLLNTMLPLTAWTPRRWAQRAGFVTDAVPVKKSSGVAKLLASSIVPPTAFVRLSHRRP